MAPAHSKFQVWQPQEQLQNARLLAAHFQSLCDVLGVFTSPTFECKTLDSQGNVATIQRPVFDCRRIFYCMGMDVSIDRPLFAPWYNRLWTCSSPCWLCQVDMHLLSLQPMWEVHSCCKQYGHMGRVHLCRDCCGRLPCAPWTLGHDRIYSLTLHKPDLCRRMFGDVCLWKRMFGLP